MSKRQTRYRLRMKVEAIEKARKEMGLTQEEFAEQGGFSVSGYRKILAKANAGDPANVGLEMVGLICSVLGWHFSEAIEQVVER